MRRVLLISLSLVLALVGWSTVCADDGFYVIPSMKVVSKTGQTTSYDTNIPPKDDGALKKGVAWPTPRFTDNGNGTVTDNLTRLIWLKNANTFGAKSWGDALTAANSLKSGDGDLTDGSKEGDWRLPNVRELQSLIDYSSYGPALPAGHPFTGVKLYYWSSTTQALTTTSAWFVYFIDGNVTYNDKSTNYYVWCVRGGS
jgi:hypothetical protein